MEPGLLRSHPPGPPRHALGFAVLCAAFGIVAGLVVWHLRGTSVGYEEFPVYSCAASFVAGGLAWRVVFRGGRPPAAARGAVAGVLAALLGHYLTFVVSIEIANVQYWVLGRKVLWTGEAPIDPLSASSSRRCTRSSAWPCSAGSRCLRARSWGRCSGTR